MKLVSYIKETTQAELIDNRVIGKVFGPNLQNTGENCIVMSFEICTPREII